MEWTKEFVCPVYFRDWSNRTSTNCIIHLNGISDDHQVKNILAALVLEENPAYIKLKVINKDNRETIIDSGSLSNMINFFDEKHAEFYFAPASPKTDKVTNKGADEKDDQVIQAVNNMLRTNNMLNRWYEVELSVMLVKITSQSFGNFDQARHFIVQHRNCLDQSLVIVCQIQGQWRLLFLSGHDDPTMTIRMDDFEPVTRTISIKKCMRAL